MLIKDVAVASVAECVEDASLVEVYELIQKCDYGFVVVLDSTTHRVPLGIVNEHTICEQLIARGRKPKELRADNVMNTRVRRVSASTPVGSCGELFRSADVTPVLVVDEKRQFCGMVTREALAAAVVKSAAPTRISPATAVPARTEIPVFGWLH